MNGQANKFYLGNCGLISSSGKLGDAQTIVAPYYMYLSADMDEIRLALNGRKARDMEIHIYGQFADSRDTITICPLASPYTAQSLNWSNKPKDYWGSRLVEKPDTGAAGYSWCTGLVKDVLDGRLYEGNPVYQAFLLNGFSVYPNRATVYTVNSAQKPYIILYSDDIAFNPIDVYPSGGAFVDRTKPAVFGWGITQETGNAVLGTVTQKSANIRWRVKGETSVNTITGAATGSQLQATVSANTFPQGVLEWAVQIVAADDTTSPWSEWAEATTVDSLSTPVALYPKSIPVDGSRPITFTWRHDIATGTDQTKFELQYSLNNGTNWTALATQSASGQSYTTTANTFAAGQVLWRVRTYNSDGIAGEWSEPVTFLVRAAPTLSITGVDSKPRPTVRWQSAGQQGYRVKAGGYDSGPRYGTEKEHTLPGYQPDGPLMISVQVQNRYEMYSPWASVQATIQNRPGEAITLTSRAVENGARLAWNTDGAYTAYLVLRDGKEVERTTETSYTDWLANGKHRYKVRGVTADGYYTDSNELAEISRTKHAVLSAVDEIGWIPLRYRRDEPPTHERGYQPAIAYRQYCGRKDPVAETDGSRTITHTFSFTLRDRALARKLSELMGRQVVYKDGFGDLVIGVLDGNTENRDWGIDTVFTITETDRGDAVSAGR